jgi:hypothetical protein
MKSAEIVKIQSEMNFPKWWHLIYDRRCDDYTHSQEYVYHEDPKAFLT